MKKIFYVFIAFVCLHTTSFAQTTAMQLSGLDCNGNAHDLFADLNSGKAVFLHFYMPNCGTCPPVAQKIQTMANNIMANHPGMITGYAMPFQNSTTCSYSSSWCSSNNLSMYMPYDSGAAQLAHYGSFGMPTVVLLGGSNHRVMFYTESFSTTDTTVMRDSILRLFGVFPNGVNDVKNSISNFSVYPNPANAEIKIAFHVSKNSNISVQIINVLGEAITTVMNDNVNIGSITKTINTANLPNGTYIIKCNADGILSEQKFTIFH
jgi:hypothetical protein